MAAVKTKLGRIACPCCGHPVVLKQNEAGTLTIGCDECDVCMFAKRGTQAAAAWVAKLPKATAPEPAPVAPAPVPAPVASKVPKAPAAPARAPAAPAPAPVKPKVSPFDFLTGGK